LTIRDLSWEDKELVLRVLFAKMNGAQDSNSSNKQRMQQSMRQQQRTQQPMPEPVFLSEGATLPPSAGAAQYQANFEMRPPGSRGRLGSNGGGGSGRGGAAGGNFNQDSFSFNAIGGGSLHSSQFSNLGGGGTGTGNGAGTRTGSGLGRFTGEEDGAGGGEYEEGEYEEGEGEEEGDGEGEGEGYDDEGAGLEDALDQASLVQSSLGSRSR
jgi:hypothetical protein